MAILPAKLATTQALTNAAATYYTSPALTLTVVKQAVFTNIDSSAHTVTVYMVASGGSAGSGNKILNAFSISANSTKVSQELLNQVLAPGDFIQALADSGAVVNISLSGYTVPTSG